jgi:hypothetical protein
MSAAVLPDPLPEPDPLQTLPETPHPADSMETPAPAELTAPHLPLGETAEAPPVHPAAGEPPEVPGYEVIDEIARGGMGVVYSARDLPLHREVAVKTLLPSLAGHAEMAAQFAREARITARLPHPGVPPVHAIGTLADGRPFLVMKLVRGRTLAAILQARGARSSPSTADLEPTSPDAPGLLQVFVQICQAVGFAHSQGIVHRDLKPANVMVGAFGEVQVMDWGLARVLGKGWRDPGVAASPGVATGDAAATLPGQAKGTPAYMPPEQARGEWDGVDARADVFALGGILCVLLTGAPPYTGTRIFDVIRKAEAADLADTFARLDACGADSELVRLAKWCLAGDPARRPPDACAVAALVEFYRLGQENRLRALEADRAAVAARRAAAEARPSRQASAVTEKPAEPAACFGRERRRRWVLAAVAAAVGLLLGAVGTCCWQGRTTAAFTDAVQAPCGAPPSGPRDKPHSP